MYPANQQQHLPLAVGYQPQYDPAFTQMMAQTMQDTQQRHDVVTSQIAQDRTRRGEMPAIDLELQRETLDAYKEDLDKIAGEYGGHYANAASKLVERIGKEASNPYYNANRYHVEQARMAQEAALRYGADALWINDPRRPGALREALDSGDLSKLDTQVVQAPDYTGIAQKLGSTIEADMQALGLSSAQIRDIEERGMSAFLQHGSRSGISRQKLMEVANQMVGAFKAAAPNMQFENREAYDWTQSDEGIVDFLLSNWAGREHSKTNLSYIGNPYLQSSDGGRETSLLGNIPTTERGAEVQANSNRVSGDYKKATETEHRLQRLGNIVSNLEQGSGIFKEIELIPDKNVRDFLVAPDSLVEEDLRIQQDLLEYYALANPQSFEQVLTRRPDGLLEVKADSPQRRTTGRSSMDMDVPGSRPAEVIGSFLDRGENALDVVKNQLNRIEKEREKFIAERPVVGVLQNQHGLSFDEAAQVAQFHETENTHLNYTVLHSLSEEAKKNIDLWARTLPIPVDGVEFYNAQGKLEKDNSRSIRKRGFVGLLEDATSTDTGIIPGKGSFTLNVGDREYILPYNNLPNPLKGVMKNTEDFLDFYTKNEAWAGIFSLGTDAYYAAKEFVPNPGYAATGQGIPGIIDTRIWVVRPTRNSETGTIEYPRVREVEMHEVMERLNTQINQIASWKLNAQPERRTFYQRD